MNLLGVVRALSFSADCTAVLDDFSEADWTAILPLCDQAQLTLPIGVRAMHRLPGRIAERIQKNLADNAIRHTRAVEAHRKLAGAFADRGVEYAVLKGFSHDPHYCADPRRRPQYDLDYYAPADSMPAAKSAAQALGYEPFRSANPRQDHLPPLIRKTGWRPRGDYYDPEMPLTLELHFRLWDPVAERFDAGDPAAFWDRRVKERLGELSFPALHPADRLSYAAWHMVRHLLRGDLRAYHVYEIAHFLHATADDTQWWQAWAASRTTHRVEAMAFRLAREWFECRLHPIAETVVNQLPVRVAQWFEVFAFSPLLALERPNKDELFLHLSLAPRLADRLSILRRRLAPVRFQTPVLDPHVPSPGPSLRWKRRTSGMWFIARRLLYHLRAVLPVLGSAIRWKRAQARPPAARWRHKPRVDSVAR